MTLKELIEKTLVNINEDLDSETVAEYREEIVGYINDAYLDICIHRLKPEKTAEVMTDEHGKIEKDQLPQDFICVEKVYSVKGKPVFFYMEKGAPVTYCKNDTLQMQYRYQPERLENDGDTPYLPDWAHYALSDYATWRKMMKGTRIRQLRGEVFYVQYLEVCSKISNMQRDRKNIVNKY